MDILNLIDNGGIFSLSAVYHFPGEIMAEKVMIKIFEHFKAIWKYEGDPNPEKPHSLLPSGKHGNGFVSCKNVLEHTSMCTIFAHELLKEIKKIVNPLRIDVVVGTAYSGIPLAAEVSRMLSHINEKVMLKIAEKDEEGNPTIIRGGIDPNKRVLLVNELMTTENGSTWHMKEAVLSCNGDKKPPRIIEPAFVLVHRSEDFELVDDSPVCPVFHLDIDDFTPEECPYCKAGSEAIDPEEGDNWELLHGRK